MIVQQQLPLSGYGRVARESRLGRSLRQSRRVGCDRQPRLFHAGETLIYQYVLIFEGLESSKLRSRNDLEMNPLSLLRRDAGLHLGNASTKTL
jgi:hypothetical protein